MCLTRKLMGPVVQVLSWGIVGACGFREHRGRRRGFVLMEGNSSGVCGAL